MLGPLVVAVVPPSAVADLVAVEESKNILFHAVKIVVVLAVEVVVVVASAAPREMYPVDSFDLVPVVVASIGVVSIQVLFYAVLPSQCFAASIFPFRVDSAFPFPFVASAAVSSVAFPFDFAFLSPSGVVCQAPSFVAPAVDAALLADSDASTASSPVPASFFASCDTFLGPPFPSVL